ncbi:MAG: hypothetical protein E7029_06445 [Planctomycetaceae bacterium]|nr:hypothetical protein [Planctomycetaceae bacterium]
MKKIHFFCVILALFFIISQAAAQQTLREWHVSLSEEAEAAGSSSASAPVSEPAAMNKKRIACIFSQTHVYAPSTGKFELDRNIAFRLGNYIQVRSVLEQYGKFEGIYTLMGPDLTKENVQKAFVCMQEETSPGDEIFIYWESHGCSDQWDHSGEEADGFNEYLFLGRSGSQHCITDDEFSDLLKKLNGRKVMILMEACHSGGLITESSPKGLMQASNFPFKDAASLENDIEDHCGKIRYETLTPLLPQIMTKADPPSTENRNFSSLRDFLPPKSLKSKTVFFNRVFQQSGGRDISGQTHSDVSVIFTAGETEKSYCALFTNTGKAVVYDHARDRYTFSTDLEEPDCLPIGAPVFALVLAITDATGEYSDAHHTDFADIWKIVKDLIPENCRRINQMRDPGTPEMTQTPCYLNTTGPIDVCPKK